MTWFAPIDFEGKPSALWCPDCSNAAEIGATLNNEPFFVMPINTDNAPTYNCHACGLDYRD